MADSSPSISGIPGADSARSSAAIVFEDSLNHLRRRRSCGPRVEKIGDLSVVHWRTLTSIYMCMLVCMYDSVNYDHDRKGR